MSESQEHVRKQKLGSRQLALIGLFAGTYAVATILIPSSYGPLNLRFSNILIGAVPAVGWPAVLGITLGVFLGNLGSNLGPIDLISTLPSFVGLCSIYLLRTKSVLLGLSIYAIILSFWVTFELSYVFGLSYIPLFYAILSGIGIIVIGFAYLFFRALKKSGLGRRFADAVR